MVDTIRIYSTVLQYLARQEQLDSFNRIFVNTKILIINIINE